MTWHAKALTTSYLTGPGGGVRTEEEGDDAFPYTTASWYFLDMVDVMAPPDTIVVCAFGDSITDGTNTTMNGDDRWPDVLSRRLHAIHGSRVSVVNAGIGGNQVVGPENYAASPIPGGPSALSRLERDVLALSGLTSVIWLEGINDFGAANASPEAVAQGFEEGVKRLRAKGVSRVVGATLTSALGATNGTHGTAEVDAKRQKLNAWIRSAAIFDGVADFDAVTIDKTTGSIRAELIPNSTVGGAGDMLHPNRVGYLAMGNAIDPKLLVPTAAKR
jgi:lysophospholipase L1-like esterase